MWQNTSLLVALFLSAWCACGGTNASVGPDGDGGAQGGDRDATIADGAPTDAPPSDGARGDGGSDAQSGDASACTSPGDCVGTRASVPFCTTTSSYSCIDHSCVWECAPGGRTCQTAVDGGIASCLLCPPAAANCAPANCAALSTPMRVGSSTCTTFPLAGDKITFTPFGAGSCVSQALRFAGADQLGYVTQLSPGTYVAVVPGQGGQCTGIELPTGAFRLGFSCPSCQFVLE